MSPLDRISGLCLRLSFGGDDRHQAEVGEALATEVRPLLPLLRDWLDAREIAEKGHARRMSDDASEDEQLIASILSTWKAEDRAAHTLLDALRGEGSPRREGEP